MKTILPLVTLLLALTLATALAADPFYIYAPSRASQSLLVIKAKETPNGLKLSEPYKMELNYPPTTIVAHPEKPFLYISTNNATEGDAPGTLVSLDDKGRIHHASPITFDHGYAYLSLDRANRFLLGVNYKTGHVDVYALKENGSVGPRIAALNEGRANAHAVLPSPDNKFVYIPYVKDTNALLQYAFDPKTGTLSPLDPPNANPPEGTGPRHIAYHPTLPYVYFSNEQGIGVSVYEKHLGDGQLVLHQVVEVIPAEDRPEKGASASDIAITPDGKFLFTGQRSGSDALPNAINRYAIDNNGSVEHLGATPADAIPWGLALSPDGQYLLVSAFKGATLTAYEITDSGDLKKAASIPIDPNISDLVTR